MCRGSDANSTNSARSEVSPAAKIVTGGDRPMRRLHTFDPHAIELPPSVVHGDDPPRGPSGPVARCYRFSARKSQLMSFQKAWM